jgi:hypothetical protein
MCKALTNLLLLSLTGSSGAAFAAPDNMAAHHWNHLPAEHRDHLLSQYHHLQHMPPHEQRILHRKLQWFKGLPPTEQARLRHLWQHLSLAERKQWLQRLHQAPVSAQATLRAQLLGELNTRSHQTPQAHPTTP